MLSWLRAVTKPTNWTVIKHSMEGLCLEASWIPKPMLNSQRPKDPVQQEEGQASLLPRLAMLTQKFIGNSLKRCSRTSSRSNQLKNFSLLEEPSLRKWTPQVEKTPITWELLKRTTSRWILVPAWNKEEVRGLLWILTLTGRTMAKETVLGFFQWTK